MIKLTVKTEERNLLELDRETRDALAKLLGRMSINNFMEYGATREQADLLFELFAEIKRK